MKHQLPYNFTGSSYRSPLLGLWTFSRIANRYESDDIKLRRNLENLFYLSLSLHGTSHPNGTQTHLM